jgi:E3 SUMO-protein ligase PIAS1
MLVEVTTVDSLVTSLKTSSYRNSQDIKMKSQRLHLWYLHITYFTALVVESLSEDDDIVAGPQKMSLKCPVRAIFKGNPHRFYSLISQTSLLCRPVELCAH